MIEVTVKLQNFLIYFSANPDALVNTVWLNNTLHFGMRSRQEHSDMLFGDVELKATSTGEQYLQFTERETKTRKGQPGNTRAFAPKMFARPGKKLKLCKILQNVQILKNNAQCACT